MPDARLRRVAGRGPWLQSLLDRKRESVYEWLKNAVNLLFVIALNVFFFLPLCAVAHPLFPGLMKDRGKQLPGSMMQTAFFQAGVFAGSDACLTLGLTLFLYADEQKVVLMLLWACGALGFELQQVFQVARFQWPCSPDRKGTVENNENNENNSTKLQHVFQRGSGFSSKEMTDKEKLEKLEELEEILDARFQIKNPFDMFWRYVLRDNFNPLDLSALLLCVASLSCALVVKVREKREALVANELEETAAELTKSFGEIERVRIWFENLGALAVLLMWFRQLRTLTIISSQMAVLWHMMVSMVGDVVSFLQMLVVVLLGFTGALAMVFYQDVVPLAVNGECDGLIGDGTTWWSISKKLFEGSMLGDAPFLECIELSNHYWTGLVLTYTFTVIVVVLLLNSMPIGARTQIWYRLSVHLLPTPPAPVSAQ